MSLFDFHGHMKMFNNYQCSTRTRPAVVLSSLGIFKRPGHLSAENKAS